MAKGLLLGGGIRSRQSNAPTSKIQRYSRAPGGGFDPIADAPVTPLSAFWATGLPYAEGADVTSWTDRGSQGRNLSTFTSAPTMDVTDPNANGRAGVLFTSANVDSMSSAAYASSTVGFTIFVVAAPSTAANTGVLWGWTTVNNNYVLRQENTAWQLRDGATTVTSTVAAAADTPALVTCSANALGSGISVNGETPVTGAALVDYTALITYLGVAKNGTTWPFAGRIYFAAIWAASAFTGDADYESQIMDYYGITPA